MNETSIKKSGSSIAVIIILIIALLGSISYIVYDKVFAPMQEKDPSVITEEEIQEEDTTTENSVQDNSSNTYTASFDSSKSINTSDTTYQLFTSFSGLNITLNTNKRAVTFSYNPTILNNRYSLGWTTSENYAYTDITINNFTKDIVDVFLGGFGQDASNDTLFFLMEDGTVEYVPIRMALLNNANTISSYGAIPSVTDIVKLYNAQASSAPSMSGYATTLAQKADGTFYDLSTLLSSTGNY